MPSDSTQISLASHSASGTTPSSTSDLAVAAASSAQSSPARWTHLMTDTALTCEPPAMPSNPADLENDTSAPAATRKDLAAGDILACHGKSSASASGTTVLPHTSPNLL